ncbi:hypothetical protein MTR67_020463 [Solanum verrucosum]|uniref:UBL3-like ubiquitin domain-containing protein n=1 Tax=Solanum verrucosum TaxID=315347 RepID=A0AAF0QRP7_SOLVR|nr:hypothetical protein MTR67_020463 [Solanum verrucosum]
MADKDSGPKTINDVKLINAGRILENNKTLGESRLPVAEVPGGVITMHVVVRPPMNEKARDKLQDDSLNKGGSGSLDASKKYQMAKFEVQLSFKLFAFTFRFQRDKLA